MNVKIEIDTKTFVRFWLVVIGFVFAILAIYSSLAALVLIGIALFLAMALNGPVSFFAKHLPGKSRVGATAIAYIFVVAVLGVFAFLVIPPIIEQTIKFSETLPAVIESASRQWHGLDQLIAQYNLQPQIDNAVASLKSNSLSWAGVFGQNLLSGIGSAAALVASGFLVLVMSFLMLIEGPDWMRRIWALYSNKDRMKSHRQLIHRMYNVVTGYVSGQLTVSAIGAVCAGIAVFLISMFVPNIPVNLALPTVAIAFTLSLIPLFGATIAGVLVSLLLAINNVSAGVIFAVYFIVYQQIENNFVAPVIQSKRVELSALAVLVAVTIGIYVFGLAGGIISIPVAGCLKVLLEDYLDQSNKKHEAAAKKPASKTHKELFAKESN